MITADFLTKIFYSKTKTGRFRSETTAKTAVDNVSFHVESGEFVGYIGPNGAGKSTTIKMLTGILLPTSGSVTVDGLDPFRERKRNGRNIGVIFGQRSQLWWHLRLDDTFRLFKHMYEIPDVVYNERLALLRDVLELDEFWHQPVRQLSLGQRMRGELAAALLHSPKILYLDEPTVGMDVMVKERIRDLLAMFNKQGVTILLTSHDLDDIERLCRRVIVINYGKILYDGTMSGLRARCGADATVQIDFKNNEIILPDRLRNLTRDGRRITFGLNHTEEEGELLAETIRLNAVKDISITEPAIEEVVREFYGDTP